MRSPTVIRIAFAGCAGLTALALAGCGVTGDRVDFTRTTGALLPAPLQAPSAPAASVCLPQDPLPVAWTAPQRDLEGSMGPAITDSAHADVGMMAYPPPDFSVHTVSESSSVPADFPETSFASSASSEQSTSGFPESSFGPNAVR